MKKFLVIAAVILAVIFVVDKTILKEQGVMNQVGLFGKYKVIEDADKLPEGLEIENLAPDFTLVDLEGQDVQLSEYRGKKILLNFWATWCPPCKAEMPYMQELYEKYNEDGFVVLAVDVTTTEKSREDVVNFVAEYGLAFPIPMDEKGQVSASYEIMAYPTSVFIDSDGVIRSKMIGGMTKEYIESEINKLP